MALGNNLKKNPKTDKSHDESTVENASKPEKSASTTTSASTDTEENKSKELSNLKHQIHEMAESAQVEEREILIVFPVSGEEFALPIHDVKEVIDIPPISPVPQVPGYILGVSNVRGEVFTVYDLALKTRLEQEKSQKSGGFLMVIDSEDFKVSLKLDQVPDTLVTSKTMIEPPTNIVSNNSGEESFVKGVLKIDKRLIMILDIKEIMEGESLSVE